VWPFWHHAVSAKWHELLHIQTVNCFPSQCCWIWELHTFLNYLKVHARFVTKKKKHSAKCQYFDTIWKDNHCSFLTLLCNRGWWSTPPSTWNLLTKWPTAFEKCPIRPISAYNVSTTRANGLSSIIANKKSTTRFPTSYSWNVYVSSNFPKLWLKKRICRFCE